MMKEFTFLVVLFFSITMGSHGQQNLVPNPGFEQYYPCDYGLPMGVSRECGTGSCTVQYENTGGLKAFYWKGIGIDGAFIYVNSCMIESVRAVDKKPESWYQPRDGGSFAIIQTYWGESTDSNGVRNYAAIKLISPLEAGCKYEVSFYVKRMQEDPRNRCRYGIGAGPIFASDGLGAYLSVDSIYSANPTTSYPNLFHLTPQIENPKGNLLLDSLKYMKISGIYTAAGGERYITIGNFRSNLETEVFPKGIKGNSKYLLDDVSVIKLTPVFNINNSQNIKEICRDSIAELKATSGMDNYTWSTGETTSSITTGTAGKYWVNSNYGCLSFSDTIEVKVRDRYTDVFSIGKDTFLCSLTNGLIISAPSGFDTYHWSTEAQAHQIQVFHSGVYSVEARYVCGVEKDTIFIEEFDPSVNIINPANDTSICLGSDLKLSILDIHNYKSLLWSTGESGHSINVVQPGRYYVNAVTNQNCNAKDSILVSIIPPPKISLDKNKSSQCEGLDLNLTASFLNSDILTWDDFSNKSIRTIKNSGTYWVKASNRCFSATDSLKIEFINCHLFIPNLITPNDDNKNDYLEIQTKIERPLTLEIYNRWGIKVYENVDYKNNWNGENLPDGNYFYHLFDNLLNKSYNGWIDLRR